MSGLSALLQQGTGGTPPPNSPSQSIDNHVDSPGLASPPPPASLGTNGSIISQLASNPIFTAGFGIVGLTASLAVLRKSLVQSTAFLRRRLLVDLEIPSKDRSYDWFLHWMSTHQRKQLQTQLAPSNVNRSLLSYIIPRTHHLAVETSYTELPGGGMSTTFALVPGPGKHLLNYHNTLIQVTRERDAKHVDLRTGSPFEVVKLTTLYRDRHIFPQLLAEAQSLAQRLTQGKTVIYTSWGTEWREFGSPKRKRPLESVILDTGIKEILVEDVKDFMSSSNWYYDRGIPYRRGYLLYGPPGSGKSSFINALAGELDYNICVLNLSERGLTDDRLNHLLTNLPDRSIALLEDVDAAFSRGSRVQTGEDGYRGANVTFSGLLNALDGVASGEERIIVLTTNHRERLDPALVRPGRVDRECYIGWASESQVRQMWRRFYGDGKTIGEEEVIRILKEAEVLPGREEPQTLGKREGGIEMDGESMWGRGISTAQLQGLFVYNKEDPEGAVTLLKKMVSKSLGDVGKEVQ